MLKHISHDFTSYHFSNFFAIYYTYTIHVGTGRIFTKFPSTSEWIILYFLTKKIWKISKILLDNNPKNLAEVLKTWSTSLTASAVTFAQPYEKNNNKESLSSWRNAKKSANDTVPSNFSFSNIFV